MGQELKSWNIKHEAIMNWLLLHPTATLKECAAAFDLSSTWLGVIVNSDAFKTRLAERQDKVFSATMLELNDKLHGLAHVGVERLAEKIESSEDPKFILDAVDKVLDRVYGKKGGEATHVTNQQININQVDSDTLVAARELMDRARLLRKPMEVLDAGESPESPEESPD